MSLGGTQSLGYAINNDGVIVGATTLASGDVRAFLWDPAVGTMVDLAGENARARDITDNGLVVGTRLSDGSAVIWVLEGPCDLFESTPSDPLLADPAVQGLLIGLGEASNFHDPAVANRIEVAGHFVQSGGVATFDEWTPNYPPNPCQNEWTTNLGTLNPDSILGDFHTHPVSSGTFVFPANTCLVVLVQGNTKIVGYTTSPWVITRGPSPVDMQEWASPTPPSWPGYVMSPDSIWRWDATEPPGGLPVITSWALNKGGNACFP